VCLDPPLEVTMCQVVLFWVTLGWDRFLWVALDCLGLLWVALGCLGLPWVALDCLGLPWVALGCLGLPWFALGCLGLPWVALDCLGLPWFTLICIGLPWNASGCIGLTLNYLIDARPKGYKFRGLGGLRAGLYPSGPETFCNQDKAIQLFANYSRAWRQKYSANSRGEPPSTCEAEKDRSRTC
jgi:hypothetical protein